MEKKILKFSSGREYYEDDIKKLMDALEEKFGMIHPIAYDYYKKQMDFDISSFRLLQINFIVDVCKQSVNLTLDDIVPTLFTHDELIRLALYAKKELHDRELFTLSYFTTCVDLRPSISDAVIYQGQKDGKTEIEIITALILVGTQRRVDFVDRGMKYQPLVYEGRYDTTLEDDIIEEKVCFEEGI